MARSLLGTVALIAVIVVGAYVTITTLNQSGTPVDLEISLSVDYDGTTVGSTTLKYHWVSNSLSQESTSETIDWNARTVTAEGVEATNVDSIIKTHLETATQSFSTLNINEDGFWTASFTILIGGSLPLSLTFSGRDVVVNDVSVSCDVSLLPSGLKSALKELGVTNIDVITGWKLVISGDFFRAWFQNLFDFLRESIQTIVEESSEFVGSLDIV